MQAGQSIGIGTARSRESSTTVSVRNPVLIAVPSVGQRIIISGIEPPQPGRISTVKFGKMGTAKPAARACAPCFGRTRCAANGSQRNRLSCAETLAARKPIGHFIGQSSSQPSQNANACRSASHQAASRKSDSSPAPQVDCRCASNASPTTRCVPTTHRSRGRSAHEGDSPRQLWPSGRDSDPRVVPASGEPGSRSGTVTGRVGPRRHSARPPRQERQAELPSAARFTRACSATPAATT